MAFIYKITNKINNKVYVGKTIYNVQKRWRQHIQESKKERSKNRPLYKAINKYGVENFIVEIIEECDVSQLSEREIYWIQLYRSYVGWKPNQGYNATLGGDGKFYCDYDKIYQLWLNGHTFQEIQTITGYAKETIRHALIDNKIATLEIRKRSNERRYRKIIMLDIKTNAEIKTFATIISGATYIKNMTGAQATVHSISTNIQRVCQGERKSAYGYSWKYL